MTLYITILHRKDKSPEPKVWDDGKSALKYKEYIESKGGKVDRWEVYITVSNSCCQVLTEKEAERRGER